MEDNVYHEENEKLNRYKRFSAGNVQATDRYAGEFRALVADYEDLLKQTILITRVGDRLQKSVKEKNDELKATIEELVKVKISRKATTVVFIVAIAIFIIVEAFIEPVIESHTDFYYGLIIKLIIVLSIKPLEMMLEHNLLNRAKRKEIISS